MDCRDLTRSLAGLVAALCLLAGCAACSRADASLERQLDAAEALLWSGDSAEMALARLTAIDTAAVADGEQRARLALLTAYARHKSYIDDTTLTVLAPALARYDGLSPRGSRRNRALALFLKGRVSFNREAYADAIIDLMKADDLLEGTDHHLLRGFIRQLISNTYSNVYLSNEQLIYTRKALEAFKQSSDSTYLAGAYADVGQSLLNNLNPQEAVAYLDSATIFAHSQGDVIVETWIHFVRARVMASLHNYEESLRSYEQVIRNNPDRPEQVDVLAMKTALDSTAKNFPLITKWLDQYNQHSIKHIISDDLQSLKHHDSIGWARLTVAQQQNVTGTVIRHNEAQSNESKIRSQQQKILLSSLLAIAILCILFMMRNRRLQKRIAESRIDRLVAELSLAEATADSQGREIETYREHLQNSTAEYFSILNDFCERSRTELSKKKTSREQVERIRMLADFFSSEQATTSFERLFDRQSRYPLSLLREEVPSLSPDEVTLYLFTAMRLSTNAIAFIMDSDASKIYNKRSYLKTKIRKSAAPHADYFLSLLG